MRRPSRQTMILGAAAVLWVGCSAFFVGRLSTLDALVRSQPSAVQVQALQAQLQTVETELERVRPLNDVLKEDFQRTEQSILKRLTVLETTADTVESLTSGLAAIATQVKHTEAAMLVLKATLEKCSSGCSLASDSAAVSGASAAPAPRAKAQPQKPAPRKPTRPPFTLVGLESRASELFLAVAPTGQYLLKDVHLLRPGMQFQGWSLSALDVAQARWVRPDGTVTSTSAP
ncbi:hypothetical protein [Pseudomonas asplenii]|uniref:hypothetical protein n=1 Tax=Pseudomonas asplenii TaxID=53407 RepID=UPI0003622E37|nr:hypothetical protein [Pseudomonas fuscovaginae]